MRRDPIGPAQPYTEFILGNAARTYTDSSGRVAYGGDAALTGFGIGSSLNPDAGRLDLIVGHNLTAVNGVNVQKGSAIYGGTRTGTVSASGTVRQGSSPVNFGSEHRLPARTVDGLGGTSSERDHQWPW